MDSSLSHDPFAPDDAIAGEAYPGYEDAKAEEVIAYLADADTDVAQRVLAQEGARKQARKTVIEAAEDRLEQLRLEAAEDNPDNEVINMKDRLLRAGVSEEEADQLQKEHDEGSAEAQQSTDERLAGISDADIRDWVESLREEGHFDDEPETPAESVEDPPGETAEQVAAREADAKAKADEAEAKAKAEREARGSGRG